MSLLIKLIKFSISAAVFLPTLFIHDIHHIGETVSSMMSILRSLLSMLAGPILSPHLPNLILQLPLSLHYHLHHLGYKKSYLIKLYIHSWLLACLPTLHFCDFWIYNVNVANALVLFWVAHIIYVALSSYNRNWHILTMITLRISAETSILVSLHFQGIYDASFLAIIFHLPNFLPFDIKPALYFLSFVVKIMTF